jgi:DNA-binding protein HU-beta
MSPCLDKGNLNQSATSNDLQRDEGNTFHSKRFDRTKKILNLRHRKQTLIYTTMTKAELITKIAEDAGITKVAAVAALDSFMDGVTKTLKKGDKLTLVGFGTFSVSKRAARVGRNPFNGETIKIKAKKVAKFKASKELSGKL